jgi:hypothetical protein
VRTGLDILESLLDARRRAEQQALEMMRRTLGALPGVGVGLTLAETASRQHRELERQLVTQVKQVLAGAHVSPKAPSAGGSDASTSSTEPTPVLDRAPSVSHAQSAQRTPGLRLTVPVGPSSVRVPIQLRNHRDESDFVTLSANVRTTTPAGIVPLPTELIRFDPQTLEIPARSTATASVILRLTPDLEVNRPYGTGILISGAEVKQIPIILQLVLPTPSPAITPALPAHAT